MALFVFSTTFGWYATLSLSFVLSILALAITLTVVVLSRRQFACDAQSIRQLRCNVRAQAQQIALLRRDLCLMLQLPYVQDQPCVRSHPQYFQTLAFAAEQQHME